MDSIVGRAPMRSGAGALPSDGDQKYYLFRERNFYGSAVQPASGRAQPTPLPSVRPALPRRDENG